MIIITERAERALTERLENIKKEAKHSRCVHIKFSSTNISAESSSITIQRYVEANIETSEQYQLFVCQDGDAYLIGNSIATKDIQFFLKYLGEALAIDIQNVASVYELPANVYPVLTSVDEKMQRMQTRQLAAGHSALSTKEQKKRHAILSVVNEEKAKASIINTRKSRTKPQIMVIEDDAFTRQLVTNIMRKQHAIEGTGNSIEMLQMYVRLAPDVLFLDINLPDITGHELLERILQLDPDAYVVMLSGNADAKNITAAMNKGAKGFVAKPFTKDKLLQYIDKRLTR